MTRRAWAAVAVLGVLVVVMIVAAVRILPSRSHAAPRATATSTVDEIAPPPPASATDGQATQASGGGGASVLGDSDVDTAHQVMASYLQSLGSYTYADRQALWQRDALRFTNGSSAIRAFTHLPTGRAWADCQHTHCSSRSRARIIRDTSTTDIPGSGAAPQVVSYVDLATTLAQHGAKPQVQHTQFTVTAIEGADGWKVAGCTFAGVGDSGANGDGP